MVWADYAGRRDRVSDDVSLRKWLEGDPVKPQYIFFWNRFLEERSKITKVLLRALGEHGRRFSIVSRNKYYFLDVPPRLLSVVDRLPVCSDGMAYEAGMPSETRCGL